MSKPSNLKGKSELAACKEEIAELRGLLAEAGGTGRGELEGKYLHQLRRNRQLGVQLEAERTRVKQLETQIADAQKKTDPPSLPNQPQPSKSKERPVGVDEAPSVPVLRERLERAYTQLNESKVQLEEQRREVQRMRRVLQQEVGGTASELEALLKAPSHEGWRGRAQQLVLLKARVRELERAMASDKGGAAPLESQPDVDDTARERVAAVQDQQLRQRRELQEALTERSHAVEAQRRRAEAAVARHAILEADNQTLREYLQSLVRKAENDNALIDAYREEMEATRSELHAAQCRLHELEEWQRGEPSSAGKTEKREKARRGSEAVDNATAVALAGADAAMAMHRLQVENAQLRHQIERMEGKNKRKTRREETEEEEDKEEEEEEAKHEEGKGKKGEDAALVMHWLRSVAGTAGATKGSNGELWTSRVATVLRLAHRTVCQSEQQQQRDAAKLEACYSEIQQLQQRGRHAEQKGNGSQVDELLSNVLLEENRSLKKRLRTLQELMESELAAHEALQAAGSATRTGTATTTATGDDGAYVRLQRQYEELRRAFNTLQQESLLQKKRAEQQT